MIDGESDGDRTTGWVVNLPPPVRLCWFVDNDTMNGKNNQRAINFEKNDNNYSRSTVKRTAEAFREGVQSGTSTCMILCPSHPTTGNPRLWLEAYTKASSDAQGQNQVSETMNHSLDFGSGATAVLPFHAEYTTHPLHSLRAEHGSKAQAMRQKKVSVGRFPRNKTKIYLCVVLVFFVFSFNRSRLIIYFWFVGGNYAGSDSV